MAKTIGQLTQATTLAFGDEFVIEQSGLTKRVAASVVRGGLVNADIDAAAAIASTKLSTTTQQALVPTGAVQAFAMNSAPAGWLAADGTAVSRSTYAALFSAISTTYGAGDGSTTFALPDLRGYFVRGSGTNSDATAAGAFGAKQADSIGAHNHDLPTTTSASPGGGVQLGSGSLTGSAATYQTGTNIGTETRPKNIAMLYCIKF
jgi:microcystin-dependent protein